MKDESSISNSEFSQSDISLKITMNPTKPLAKRILLIDDEKLVRCTFKRYFQRLENDLGRHYEVTEAENALTGLNTVYENYLLKNVFDILIIDECMPFMKGSSLIKLLTTLHLEGNFNKMMVISHTSFDSTELKHSILNSGADFIWNKPIQYEEFKNFFIKL